MKYSIKYKLTFYKMLRASNWQPYMKELTYIKNIKFTTVKSFGKYFMLERVRMKRNDNSSRFEM
jgi:hypothetical protein